MTTAPPFADTMIQKWLRYFERESVQRSIRERVVDPILNHILKQVFPYILLNCVMFVLLLFSVLVTLDVILFQGRASGPIPSIALKAIE